MRDFFRKRYGSLASAWSFVDKKEEGYISWKNFKFNVGNLQQVGVQGELPDVLGGLPFFETIEAAFVAMAGDARADLQRRDMEGIGISREDFMKMGGLGAKGADGAMHAWYEDDGPGEEGPVAVCKMTGVEEGKGKYLLPQKLTTFLDLQEFPDPDKSCTYHATPLVESPLEKMNSTPAWNDPAPQARIPDFELEEEADAKHRVATMQFAKAAGVSQF
jgi:hypothetical protein